MSIVVTGATGHLGRLVVEQLLARGVAPDDVVAAGRQLGPLADLEARGVRTAVFDYDAPAEGVLAAGDTVLLVSMPVPGNRVAQHGNALEAAAKAGVGRVVYTSAPHATDTTLVLAPEHKATEELIRAGGVTYTILRNNWYTEGYAQTLAQAARTGVILGSAGSGRVASASRVDYAAATAAVLTTDGHDDATYELTGDVAWDFTEFAQAAATVLGRDVEYRSVSPEEHLATLIAAGLPDGTAGFVVALDGNIREGTLGDATGDLARLAGRPSTPLVDGLRTLAQSIADSGQRR
ncbi:MAG TPA: NAD(P)H-binding protein [Mycobacteriales bacterium]|jgi:NAD(P)H dehydrogenase (quinone)|nr:NAD(P)H-binding protein [Mycobacteriales bacterium]